MQYAQKVQIGHACQSTGQQSERSRRTSQGSSAPTKKKGAKAVGEDGEGQTKAKFVGGAQAVGVGDEYEGQFNKLGRRGGKGTCRFAHGDIYEGEWKDGRMHGSGRYLMPDGDLYEGVWRNGSKQGPGTMWYASGRADVVSFEKDADASEGARWSADRQMAWRLHAGDLVEEISLQIAQQIAERLGEPVPPLCNPQGRGVTSPMMTSPPHGSQSLSSSTASSTVTSTVTSTETSPIARATGGAFPGAVECV